MPTAQPAQPSTLFRDLKPRSEAAVRQAIETLTQPGSVGLLAAQIRDGKVEFFWTNGPAVIQIDPWRLAPPRAS